MDRADTAPRLVIARSVGHTTASGPESLGRVEFARMVSDALGLRSDLFDAQSTSELGLRPTRSRAAGLLDTKIRGRTGRPLASLTSALGRMASRG